MPTGDLIADVLAGQWFAIVFAAYTVCCISIMVWCCVATDGD